jgi:hypothetical protein
MGKYQFQIEPQLSKIHEDREIPILLAKRNIRIIAVYGGRFSGKSMVCQAFQREGKAAVVRARRSEGIFGKIVSTVCEYGSNVGNVPPVVFIDGLSDVKDVCNIIDFFQPRVKFIETHATDERRIERARSLEGDVWQKERLNIEDSWLIGFKDQLRDSIDAHTELRRVIDTTDGISAKLEEIRSFVGLISWR